MLDSMTVVYIAVAVVAMLVGVFVVRWVRRSNQEWAAFWEARRIHREAEEHRMRQIERRLELSEGVPYVNDTENQKAVRDG